MKKNNKSPSLAKNHRNLRESGSHGPFQPPRNSVVAMVGAVLIGRGGVGVKSERPGE